MLCCFGRCYTQLLPPPPALTRQARSAAISAAVPRRDRSALLGARSAEYMKDMSSSPHLPSLRLFAMPETGGKLNVATSLVSRQTNRLHWSRMSSLPSSPPPLPLPLPQQHQRHRRRLQYSYPGGLQQRDAATDADEACKAAVETAACHPAIMETSSLLFTEAPFIAEMASLNYDFVNI